MILIDIKTCKGCGRELPMTMENFYFRSSGYTNSNCIDCEKAVFKKRFSENKDYRERHRELTRQRHSNQTQHTAAQSAARHAVRNGKLTPLPCERCGRTDDIHAHHDSYQQKDWLNVMWLCRDCHMWRHRFVLGWGTV
jgi:hypothetical protein